MIIKDIFQETSGVFKRNFKMYIIYFVAFFAILFATAAAILLLDPSFSFILCLLAIAIILPMFTSIDYIAKKSVNGNPLDYSDFYIGHKNFLTSITLQSKVLSRGVLFSFLGYLAGGLVGMLVLTTYMMNANPEIVNELLSIANSTTIDFQAVLDILNSVTYLDTALIIIDIFSLLVMGVMYIFQGKRYTFLPFICFETAFNLNTSVEIAHKSSNSIGKKFFFYNLIYLVVIAAILGAGVGVYNLCLLALEEMVALIIAAIFVCLLLTPLYFYYKISLYVIYASYFKAAIDEKFKQKLESLKNQQK